MRVILALALAVVPAAARTARADSYIGLAGGLAMPLSDDQYTDTVDTSPVLGVRAGTSPKDFGGYLSFEWMPADVKPDGTFGFDVSAHRFRVIVGPELRHPVSNTLSVTARAGIGLDIAHDSVEGTVLGANIESSETDVGLGFEFAGGIWIGVGGVQIGGEISLPVGIHDDDANETDYNYDYTAVDLQLLAGVRFISH